MVEAFIVGAAGTVAVNDFHLVSAVGTRFECRPPCCSSKGIQSWRVLSTIEKVVVAKASTPKTSHFQSAKMIKVEELSLDQSADVPQSSSEKGEGKHSAGHVGKPRAR